MAKTAIIRDPEAIRLINARAAAENRSAVNAAETTIREALGPVYPGNHTTNWRAGIREKSAIPSPVGGK